MILKNIPYMLKLCLSFLILFFLFVIIYYCAIVLTFFLFLLIVDSCPKTGRDIWWLLEIIFILFFIFLLIGICYYFLGSYIIFFLYIVIINVIKSCKHPELIIASIYKTKSILKNRCFGSTQWILSLMRKLLRLALVHFLLGNIRIYIVDLIAPSVISGLNPDIATDLPDDCKYDEDKKNPIFEFLKKYHIWFLLAFSITWGTFIIYNTEAPSLDDGASVAKTEELTPVPEHNASFSNLERPVMEIGQVIFVEHNNSTVELDPAAVTTADHLPTVFSEEQCSSTTAELDPAAVTTADKCDKIIIENISPRSKLISLIQESNLPESTKSEWISEALGSSDEEAVEIFAVLSGSKPVVPVTNIPEYGKDISMNFLKHEIISLLENLDGFDDYASVKANLISGVKSGSINITEFGRWLWNHAGKSPSITEFSAWLQPEPVPAPEPKCSAEDTSSAFAETPLKAELMQLIQSLDKDDSAKAGLIAAAASLDGNISAEGIANLIEWIKSYKASLQDDA